MQLEFDQKGNVIYSVEECVFLVNEAVGRLGFIQVRGEISSLSISKGAMAFFDLKDASGKEYVMQCSLFGWKFSKYKHLLQDGMEVIITGRLKVYEKRGSLSLIAEDMVPSGEGAWKKALEELKKKLREKGYFDESRKRPIPVLVRKIGLITSEDGQALHDFRKNLGRYGFQVFLKSVWVEGDKAEQSIVRAFQWLNKNRSELDVLVLMRGGGGFENLKAFHSEAIADEIVSSRIPVITGIGHEQDESIADFAADVRCSTPTAVAVFLTERRQEVLANVDMFWDRIQEDMQGTIKEAKTLLQEKYGSLERGTQRILERHEVLVARAAEKLHRGFGRVFESFARIRQRLVAIFFAYERHMYMLSNKVEKAQSMLISLNPENVLQRGYSIVVDQDKKVLQSSRSVAIGDTISVRLFKGTLGARVEEKE